jgi:hypothetical protein
MHSHPARQTNLRTIAVICAAVFTISAGVRALEYLRWDFPVYKLDHELLLATNDAYYWVAGAEGANPVSAGMPMALLLKLSSAILRVSPANLAFWTPAILASVAVIPVALWGLQFGAPFAGFAAAVLCALAPAFYNRTRLGFYDTDWATLFFPLLIGWLMAVWIAPLLRGGEVVEDPGAPDAGGLAIPGILPLLAAFSLPWHSSIGLYLIALLWLAVLLIAVKGEAGRRSTAFEYLLVMALAISAGWPGALAGLLLLWLMRRQPEVFRRVWVQRVMLGALLLILILVTGSQFQVYLSNVISVYTGGVLWQAQPVFSAAPVVFPDPVISVRETQNIDLKTMLEGAAYLPLVGVLGIAGYLYLAWRKPVSLLLLPLLALGLGALRLGARFTMFATPVILLGLLVPAEEIYRKAGKMNARIASARHSILLLGLVIVLPGIFGLIEQLPVEPVLGRGHAEALVELGSIPGPDGMAWTWWDYGYATQHFARLGTFADGTRNSGEYLFALGFVLGVDDISRSARLMRYSEWQDHEPWQTWRKWEAKDMDAWLVDLEGYRRPEPMHAPQYLVVQWEAIPFLPWIQYLGNWEFEAGSGERSKVAVVRMPLELDLETGTFRFDEGRSARVQTVDILNQGRVEHLDFPENTNGPHLVLNAETTGVVLLDETAYRSTLVQLLIMPAEAVESVPEFDLLVDRLPSARIFGLNPEWSAR